MKVLNKRMRSWLVLLVALLALGLPRQSVWAHAEAEESEPPAGALVAVSPAQVQITFTQDLFRREGMNHIEVYDAAGARVDLDDPVIDDDNRRLLSVSLQPALADGEYTVRWFSLSSEDGHEGEGEFRFTVASAAATAIAEEPITATDSITESAALTSSEEAAAPPAPVEATTTAPVEPTVAEPADESPTATPASSTGFGLNCLGSAPLGLAVGLSWLGRRRLVG